MVTKYARKVHIVMRGHYIGMKGPHGDMIGPYSRIRGPYICMINPYRGESTIYHVICKINNYLVVFNCIH